MKYFLVLALCLSAVVAEELHDRHYSQHHQTLEEAKRKISDVLDGQHADYEEVGTYGGLGGVGVGTVGFLGQAGSEYGSSSGSNAEFSSSAASNYGASHSANLASSAGFGSNANYATSGYGSGSHQSGSSVLIPLVGGDGTSSYAESSAAKNVPKYLPEVLISGGVGGHENYLGHEEHRSNNQVVTPFVYSAPSAGSEKFYHHEERRAQSQTSSPVIQFAPSSAGSENYVHHEERRIQNQAVPLIHYTAPAGGSEKYFHHEERRVQNQAVPIIQYTAPSGGSEKYVHIKEEHVQQAAPMQLVVTSPAGGQESFMKYRKVTSTASQPQLLVHTAPSTSSSYHHESAIGATSGSQLGSLVTGGVSGTNSNYKTGYYGNSAYTVPSTSFGSAGLSSGNSNSLLKTGFGSSHQVASNFGSSSAFGAGHQAGFGTNSAGFGTNNAYTDGASFGSKFGSTFGAESKFGSQFGAESAFGSGSTFATGSSSSGLHNYMQESERLAKLQAQGMAVGGTRAGGSQFGANLESGNTAGFGGFGGLSLGTGAGVGAGNSGYKTKSWEKASKWSSQSEFGPDGHVNNYKELSTGESENFDINGRRAGYRAATTTLDDNGKVSSYSLHT